MRWDDLTIGQKSALMRIYINNGVTSLDDMRSHYNSFAEGGKTKPPYKEWVKKVNPDFVGPDYNLEAAYNALPYETLEAWRLNPKANHLPDTYKRPNHPTFSEESVYSQGPIKGGTWYYEPIRQGQYMPRELLVGGINGVEPNPMYRSFDEGGSPDIPPYWGQPTGQPQGPIDYLSRYVRSQAFEERAPNDRYVRQARQNVGSFKGVESLDVTRYNTGSFANPSEHIVGMFPGKTFTPYAPYDSGFAAPYSSVLAHEFGHIIDPNYVGQRNAPASYLNLYEQRPQELNDHDSRPQEIYADLQSLRYQLYEKHIYDIINDGAFNEKHLDKALKQEIPNRLLYTMPKETLIQMMNTIADNAQPTQNVADTYVMPTDLGLGTV